MSNPEDISPDIAAEAPEEANAAPDAPDAADAAEVADADLVEEHVDLPAAEPEAKPVVAPDRAPVEPPPVAVVKENASLPPAGAPLVAPSKPIRRKKKEGDSLWELVKTVVYAVLIAVVVRTVFFQPFNIPSGSMENTLLVGDYLFVSKFSYGYSLYSLPWGYWLRRHVDLPGRIFGSQPNRGDIVVFKFPPDNKTDYIKRLIGLPGDRIQMKDGVLYINDKAVPRTYVGDDTEVDESGIAQPAKRYRETLPNGVTYVTLDLGPSYMDNTDVFVVPPGKYFMMGDNRDNSDDSRGHVGMVPFENLVGRAQFVWLSIDDTAVWYKPWTWPGAIRYDRLATFVD